MLRQGCSLIMLHRSCEKLHGGVRFSRLSMPNTMHILFILSPGILRRILSHILCKLNLPTFLFSVGLLTLMYNDSLKALTMPWSSLLIILKLY